MFKGLKSGLGFGAAYLLIGIFFLLPSFSHAAGSKNIPANQYGVHSSNPYVVDRFMKDGKTIDEVIVPGPPTPPVRRQPTIRDAS